MISCVDDYFMITQLEKCIPFPLSSSNYFTNSLIYLSVLPFLVSGQPFQASHRQHPTLTKAKLQTNQQAARNLRSPEPSKVTSCRSSRRYEVGRMYPYQMALLIKR
jgi:hypothetical protein